MKCAVKNSSLVGTVIPSFTAFSVAQQLEQVILRLLQASFGRQLYDKICDCLEAYREVCIECDQPGLYNDFMQVLKKRILYVVEYAFA